MPSTCLHVPHRGQAWHSNYPLLSWLLFCPFIETPWLRKAMKEFNLGFISPDRVHDLRGREHGSWQSAWHRSIGWELISRSISRKQWHWMCLLLWNLKAQLEWQASSKRPKLLQQGHTHGSFSRQLQQLGTRYLNICAYEGYSYSNHYKCIIVILFIASLSLSFWWDLNPGPYIWHSFSPVSELHFHSVNLFLTLNVLVPSSIK